MQMHRLFTRPQTIATSLKNPEAHSCVWNGKPTVTDCPQNRYQRKYHPSELLNHGQSAKERVEIREASFKDFPQISALQARYRFPRKTFVEWSHLWINNPAYLETRPRAPIGWVLERSGGQIIGYLGNIPLSYELEGQSVLASAAHSWVVDDGYRSYALLLLDRYFSQPRIDLFLNATVGPDALKAFSAFDSLPVPVGAWDRTAFWITNSRGFTASWLTTKGLDLLKPFSSAIAAVPFLRQMLTRPRINPRQHLELQDSALIDDRFESFWFALKNAKRNILLGVRSRQILQWHFQHALAENRAWLVIATRDRVMTAYGIFFRHDNDAFNLKRMRLVEFQSLDKEAAALELILCWAVSRCEREGIDMLESIGWNSDRSKIIDNIAPYRRQLPAWLYFYKARSKELGDRLSEPSVWEPSQFDGDASI